jgi:hypothetical protein
MVLSDLKIVTDKKGYRYRTHIFFDFKYNLGILLTIVIK